MATTHVATLGVRTGYAHTPIMLFATLLSPPGVSPCRSPAPVADGADPSAASARKHEAPARVDSWPPRHLRRVRHPPSAEACVQHDLFGADLAIEVEREPHGPDEAGERGE